MDRFAAVDGVRSMVHLSLIALHTAMITTAHLPQEGPLWNAVKSHWLYTTAQAGGVQVDIFFMLSGFLLVYQLLYKYGTNYEEKGIVTGPGLPNLLSFTIKRALRMLPPIIAVIVCVLFVGEAWDYGDYWSDFSTPIYYRISLILTFLHNYADQVRVGSFAGSLMWSCAVDLHAGMFILVVFKIAERLGFGKPYFSTSVSSTHTNIVTKRCRITCLAYQLRWVFIILTLVAVGIRAILFEKNSINLILLGDYAHFGAVQTDFSYRWIRDYFPHPWPSTYAFNPVAHQYLYYMYTPTHTRFGPFMVGGVLACNVVLAEFVPKTRGGDGVCNGLGWYLSKFAALISCLVAVIQLAMPCIPPPDEAPPEVAMLIVTAALRILSSAGAATLLYTAMVTPQQSVWYSKPVSALFQLPIWKPIARISYCSYLVHFRLLMGLLLHPHWRSVTGLALPSIDIATVSAASPTTSLSAVVETSRSSTAAVAFLTNQWMLYIVMNFALGATLSLLLAAILYYTVEAPCASLFSSLLPQITRGGVNSGNDNTKQVKMKDS